MGEEKEDDQKEARKCCCCWGDKFFENVVAVATHPIHSIIEGDRQTAEGIGNMQTGC